MAMWWMLVACVLIGDREREGDDPGECTDGADNDVDGLFDCNDPDCAGAPDCEDGVAPPTLTGGTTPKDTGDETEDDRIPTGPPPDDAMAAACAGPSANPMVGGIIELELAVTILSQSCLARFTGETTGAPNVEGRCVTFDGSWSLFETDCPNKVNNAVWVPSDGTVFHTFQFNDEGTELISWVAHTEFRDGLIDGSDEQFWVSDFVGPDLLNGGTTILEETQSDGFSSTQSRTTVEIIPPPT
ncbi:MAG: hypothetical protein AAGA48_02315 [Myxococcota bacterium]